jgi:hypothetical protein
MRPRLNNEILLRIAQAESMIDYCLNNKIHPKEIFSGKKLVPYNGLNVGANLMKALFSVDVMLKSTNDDVHTLSQTIDEYSDQYFLTHSSMKQKLFKVVKSKNSKSQNNILIHCLIWGMFYRNLDDFLSCTKNRIFFLERNMHVFSGKIAALISIFCFRSSQNLIVMKKNLMWKHRALYRRIYDEEFLENDKLVYILYNVEEILRFSHSLEDMLCRAYECEKYQSDIAAFVWGCASSRFKKEKLPVFFRYLKKYKHIDYQYLINKGTQLMNKIKSCETVYESMINSNLENCNI